MQTDRLESHTRVPTMSSSSAPSWADVLRTCPEEPITLFSVSKECDGGIPCKHVVTDKINKKKSRLLGAPKIHEMFVASGAPVPDHFEKFSKGWRARHNRKELLAVMHSGIVEPEPDEVTMNVNVASLAITEKEDDAKEAHTTWNHIQLISKSGETISIEVKDSPQLNTLFSKGFDEFIMCYAVLHKGAKT